MAAACARTSAERYVGRPGPPHVTAFAGMRRAPLTDGTQGVNVAPGIWRGVLTPLAAPGLFAVIDRIGAIPNLRKLRLRLSFRVAAD